MPSLCRRDNQAKKPTGGNTKSQTPNPKKPPRTKSKWPSCYRVGRGRRPGGTCPNARFSYIVAFHEAWGRNTNTASSPPTLSSSGGEGEDRAALVHGCRACAKQKEALNESSQFERY